VKLKSHRFSCFALLRSEEFGDEGVEEGCKGVKANSTEVERQKHVHVPLGEELEHNVQRKEHTGSDYGEHSSVASSHGFELFGAGSGRDIELELKRLETRTATRTATRP
jgi:hypothetical protein